MKKVILTSAALYKLIEFLKKEIGFYASKPRFRRIEKLGEKIYVMTFHTKNGKYNILIDIGKMLFTFGKLKIEDSYNDRLTIFLNRKLKNMKVSSIFQHNLDRIVVFETEGQNGLKIIFELFGGGNLIITDSSDTIIDVYREFETKKRIIKKGETYLFPQDSYQKIIEIINERGKILRRDLFRHAPLDPITLNSLIQEEKKEFRLEDINSIFTSGKQLVERSLEDECIYLLEADDKLYIHPYLLKENENVKRICGVKDITEFLMQKMFSEEKSYEEKLLKEIERLEKKIEELIKEKRYVMDILNSMYTYIPQLSTAFEILRRGEDIDRVEIYRVEKIDRKNKTVDLKKDEITIKLRYDMNPYSSISHAYDKIKSYDDAIANLKRKIEEIKARLKEERKRQKMKRIVERKTLSKKWFEKFVWSISTNGFLIVAGKDATTNEILVKKYMENHDLVFHSEIHGSPFTLLKKGIEARSDDLFDAALITASYSKAWKIGVSTVPVYYVKPEQISKKAPSGEYMKKGSFMIYGKKNYIRGILLELFIGVISDDGVRKILVGSKKSVLKNSIKEQRKVFRLTQGKTPKSKIVSKVVKDMVEEGLLDHEYIEEYVNDLVNRLPSGSYRIEKINRKVLEKT